EEATPVLVENLEEALRFENPGIVDENVDLGQRVGERLASGSRRDVGGNAADLAGGNLRGKFCDRRVDLGLRPAVDDDIRARRGQPRGDRMADAGSGTRYQRRLSRKVDLHEPSPSSKTEIS